MRLFKSSTADLLVLLCCTSLLFRITAAVAIDFNLQIRKTLTTNLVCEETLPVARTWPAVGPHRSSFRDLVQLCGRVAGQATVGCLCDTPYTKVDCPETTRGGTHPVLWQRYRAYCQRYCQCDKRPDLRWTLDDERFISDNAADLDPLRQGLRRLTRPPVGSEPRSHPISRALNAIQEGMCGGSCSAITQQCSSGSTGQCKCTAHPVGGASGPIVQFSGSCAAVHSVSNPSGRRRDDQAPDSSSTSHMVADDIMGFFAANGDRITCPCNATYVSYSCCEKRTGIVWEMPDKKLGQLKAST